MAKNTRNTISPNAEASEICRLALIDCWHRMILSHRLQWQLCGLNEHAQMEAFWNLHCQSGGSLGLAVSEGRRLEQQYRYNGIRLITALDKLYPAKLRKNASISPVLAVKGKIDVLSALQVAIVGSREIHELTPQMTSFIADELIVRDYVITSGGAHGTDAIAHRQAMLRERPTIVVAGTGADIVFPATSRDIFEYASHYGAVVSPYPSGVQGRAFNFPARNAIIAGLSDAVIVVQCRAGSGALYTANYANQMGRPVLVPSMPGFSDLTEGSLDLARRGKAQWLTSVADLDRLSGFCAPFRQLHLPVAAPDKDKTDKIAESTDKISESIIDTDDSEPKKCIHAPLAQVIVEKLRNHPKTRECLRLAVSESGIDTTDFDEILLDLELAGQVIQCGGQYGLECRFQS